MKIRAQIGKVLNLDKCIGCHTAGFGEPSGYLRKMKDTKLVDVGCESCHGPGSKHVTLASNWSIFWDREIGYGLPVLKGADKAETQIYSSSSFLLDFKVS